MYNAYITRIKNMHKHPNADRLQIGECFGNAVIVSMEYEDNQLGVYFPSDGQLSAEFAEAKETTDLPDNPDYKKINEFVASVNERIVRGEV